MGRYEAINGTIIVEGRNLISIVILGGVFALTIMSWVVMVELSRIGFLKAYSR
jgi:hypothetical protein